MNVKNSYTLADVAMRAEVSEITVSRVLRNKTSVAEKTRERVLAVVREMGYVPNRVAGTLASSGSNLIGVVLPSLSNIVFPDVLRGIHASLASSGYQPVVGVTDYDIDVEEALVASLLSWQPAAMILSGLHHTDYTVEMLKRSGVRIAELMDIDSTPLDIAVGMSHRQAGVDTALHLHRRGYRRFGYVGHDRSRDLRAARRYEGFRQGLADVGLSLVGEVAANAPSSTMVGRELLGQLLAKHRDLDAVVFSNDDMAVGGVFHCFAAGIRPREDLALFGFNGLDIGQALPQPLSTIRSHRFLIGKTAAEMILEAPEHPGTPTIRDTGYEIVEGATA
ncbi:LacI family DNA-binding transcriptional regulator [Kaistia granuli]|uniref:LacI family DNA-binding transcriptional regulator n=1 Tax=Kaistia granuli TaxID=363259 RepID=UPI00036F3A89|nr:LacI family DNA-binding transcriptional regulator [Kaistia granuli]